MVGSALMILLGLVALVIGGEGVVRGATFLAGLARIPTVIIGLTVVALGTSSPELAVAVRSALAGEPDFVIGNVVGSNIYNVLLVLGASALVVPLTVQRGLIRWDIPVMVGASLGLWLLAADGELSRLDGGILVGALAIYLGLAVWQVRRQGASDSPAEDAITTDRQPVGALRIVGFVGALLIGLGLLVLGAGWVVEGAVDIAERFGFDRLVIGLTVVALGTSMPELATSLMAVVRGQRDLAVGNIVGSNIMNLLAVAGGTSLITSGTVEVAPAAITFDIPVMVAVAVACLPILFTGHNIKRWEGLLFLGYAVLYTTFLVLQATDHRALGLFREAMLLFVLPLTAVTVALVAVRSIQAGRWRATWR